MIKCLIVHSKHQGLVEITHLVYSVLKESQVEEGICHLFLQHTSASLLIQENADTSARQDLEHWMNRLVKENDPLFTHTLEGPDDMPSHIKSVLTSTSLTIPIVNNQLALGTWQGIYLWEHRHQGQARSIVVYIGE